MLGVESGTVGMDLLILPSIKANFASRVQAPIAVVAPRENGDIVVAMPIIKQTADAVLPVFSDQKRTTGAATPAEVVDYINVLLRPSRFR